MVTWGANTTHSFGGAPAPTTGAPAFGASPAATTPPAFGTPTAAPAGSLFGTSAPAPSTGLFGTPAPAPSGGLFGSAPSSGGVFGTPSAAPATSGFFNTSAPAPSAFGGTLNSGVQPPQTQIPAQAALQAHMDASARQEAERVRSALERIHQAYSGGSTSANQDNPKFVAIVYDPLTPEQRVFQWLQSMGDTRTIHAPDRPWQVSEEQWKKAVVENPDPQNYTPQALIGATALQRRIAWQQERAQDLVNHASTMQKSQETIKDRASRAREDIEEKVRRHAALRKRLLDVMRRVELARCMNQQLQPDELKATQRIMKLNNDLEGARGTLVALQDMVRTQAATTTQSSPVSVLPDAAALSSVLKDHRQKLFKMLTTAERDQRDIALLQQRTVASARPN